MKICIVGAGAVGALIGARLARAGHEVSALARGATLEAIRAHGVRVAERDAAGREIEWRAAVAAESDPARLGPQDLVVIAVKAPALHAAADAVAALLQADTVVLPAMNGVPWWFFEHAPGALRGARLRSVDPDGAIAARIPVERVLGAVVHWAAECPEPGRVRLNFGNRLILGEPATGSSARLEATARACADAGFDVEASSDIRREVWFKLWGNMTMNPVSAVTGATADRILDDALLARWCIDCMTEAAAVGERIGCPVPQSAQARMDVTRRLGAFRTSMLQDVDAGRAVELDALVGAVREIGERVGVPTPSIDVLFGLARLHARVRGLYPEAAPGV